MGEWTPEEPKVRKGFRHEAFPYVRGRDAPASQLRVPAAPLPPRSPSLKRRPDDLLSARGSVLGDWDWIATAVQDVSLLSTPPFTALFDFGSAAVWSGELGEDAYHRRGGEGRDGVDGATSPEERDRVLGSLVCENARSRSR